MFRTLLPMSSVMHTNDRFQLFFHNDTFECRLVFPEEESIPPVVMNISSKTKCGQVKSILLSEAEAVYSTAVQEGLLKVLLFLLPRWVVVVYSPLGLCHLLSAGTG